MNETEQLLGPALRLNPMDLVERPCGEYSGITPSPLKHVEARQVNDSSVRCVVNVTLRDESV